MMCVNDSNKNNRPQDQEDFVDVVANVGGKALEGAKVGAAGGEVGVIVGAALGGAVGAAQTVQADRLKVAGGSGELQAQPVASATPPAANLAVSDGSVEARAAGAKTEQQLKELIALLNQVVAQRSSAAKTPGRVNAGEEHEETCQAAARPLIPERLEANEAESAEAKDRRMQRAAAVRAAKSVAAINSARAQQQQAARKIAREQRKLAKLGVVPAPAQTAGTNLQPQQIVTRDIKSPQPPALATSGEPISNTPAAPDTTGMSISPEVTALLDQLAAITPLVTQLAVQPANPEVVASSVPAPSLDTGAPPVIDQTTEESYSLAGDEFEENEGEDLFRDGEELSTVFVVDDDYEESPLDWQAGTEGTFDELTGAI